MINLQYIGNPGTTTLFGSVQRVADSGYYRPDTGVFSSGLTHAQRAIALTEDITASGYYRASVNADSWNDGEYMFVVQDSGSSLYALGGESFYVQDGVEYTQPATAPAYYADIELNRDNANSRDEYTVSWFSDGTPVTSTITSPNIRVVKRDGTELISTTSMTKVVTGVYKYDSTTRVSLGETYLVESTAIIAGSTRTARRLIGRDTI